MSRRFCGILNPSLIVSLAPEIAVVVSRQLIELRAPSQRMLKLFDERALAVAKQQAFSMSLSMPRLPLILGGAESHLTGSPDLSAIR